MNYVVKSITNKQALKNALAFGTRIFGGEPDFGYAGYSDEMIGNSGDLLIFTESVV